MKLLYDQDFYQWTQRSADLLRRGCYAELDIEHIAEELAEMGSRDRRELTSRIKRILEHKLKLLLTAGPVRDRNRAGWMESIVKQQTEIEIVLMDSPSLRRELESRIPTAYALAVRIVKRSVPNRASEPPAVCPWTIEEILGSSDE